MTGNIPDGTRVLYSGPAAIYSPLSLALTNTKQLKTCLTLLGHSSRLMQNHIKHSMVHSAVVPSLTRYYCWCCYYRDHLSLPYHRRR